MVNTDLANTSNNLLLVTVLLYVVAMCAYAADLARSQAPVRKKALVGVGEIDGHPVMLAKPQTYMNLCGGSLAPLMEKHSIGTDRLIVVYDELDLPWMSLRIKPKGSAAGHNGMKSVIGSLKTSEIVRVRLGIHPGHPVRDGAEFVLAPMRRAQKKELDELVGYAADAVGSIIAEGVEKAMTKFNRRAPGSNTEDA